MNEEQNTPGKTSEAEQDTSKVFLTTDSTLQTQDEFENKEKTADSYYSVDDPKKDVHSTIGDGEMHDEGLVGEGFLPPENPYSSEGSTDEQDTAELRDSDR